MPEEGAGSSTAAGDAELKATAMAQEAVDPNWEMDLHQFCSGHVLT
ncbi:hypothetical protein [Paracoccus sp. SY]|nr:hypothetical protein [Paracoccus sp. SY]